MFFGLIKDKEPKPKPKKLIVPDEKVLIVLSLWDTFSGMKHCEDKVARYNFWKKIVEIFPETDKGRWEFSYSSPLHPCVIERLDDED